MTGHEVNGRLRGWLGLPLRLLLGGLFVYAGLQKLREPAQFAEEIANYQLLPALAPLLAATLPCIEVVVGGVLLGGARSWRRAAAATVALLSLVFTVAVSQALARGINIECGCFGTGGGPLSLLTVLRDVALTVASLLLVRLDRDDEAGMTPPAP
jgi:uncharacterized membrane protein YphA (DoxX/SURF4 family)